MQIPPERLDGWLDRFAERHGELVVLVDGDQLLLQAPDRAEARIWLRWGRLTSADLLGELVASELRPRTVGALLVRRKAHAVGVFHGAELLLGRHDHHYVQGRTKAGGWSQQRYARRRANQASRAFDEATSDAVELLLPRLDELDALALGGEGPALRSVLDHPALSRLRDAGLPQIGPLAVPDPNAQILTGFGELLRRVPIELNVWAQL